MISEHRIQELKVLLSRSDCMYKLLDQDRQKLWKAFVLSTNPDHNVLYRKYLTYMDHKLRQIERISRSLRLRSLDK